jgi:hypothetical protein
MSNIDPPEDLEQDAEVDEGEVQPNPYGPDTVTDDMEDTVEDDGSDARENDDDSA